ncbi:hypothetical protein [Caenimonas soli]|uniref:hypothetical protein n=1 Tax=Caenimonas soli TaxID=2735555 RepID=UPI0038B23D4D
MLLFGPPGVGKTHLISGLGHALRRRSARTVHALLRARATPADRTAQPAPGPRVASLIASTCSRLCKQLFSWFLWSQRAFPELRPDKKKPPEGGLFVPSRSQ